MIGADLAIMAGGSRRMSCSSWITYDNNQYYENQKNHAKAWDDLCSALFLGSYEKISKSK